MESKTFSLFAHCLSRGVLLKIAGYDQLWPTAPPEPAWIHTVRDWEPRNDNIIVLPLIAGDRSQGGILLAESSRETPQRGVVLAIGRGLVDPERLRLLPVETAVGQLVTYGRYSGLVHELEPSLSVLMMRNVEFMASKAPGTYALVEHLLDAGLPRERYVYHEVGQTCGHCPIAKHEAMDAERERARLHNREVLGYDSPLDPQEIEAAEAGPDEPGTPIVKAEELQ